MSGSKKRLVLLACVLMPLPEVTAQELGQIIGDDVYVNCEYHVAAHFPEEPIFRDLEYQDGERTVSARQFYVEDDESLLSVTVAHFEGGPERDWDIVERAVEMVQSKGEPLFDMRVWYDQPYLDGRQLRVELDDGRLLRATVYNVDYRLYITEAISEPNDFDAILFSESVSLIDETGTDYESNPVELSGRAPGTSAGLPSRRYDCSRLYR